METQKEDVRFNVGGSGCSARQAVQAEDRAVLDRDRPSQTHDHPAGVVLALLCADAIAQAFSWPS